MGSKVRDQRCGIKGMGPKVWDLRYEVKVSGSNVRDQKCGNKGMGPKV